MTKSKESRLSSFNFPLDEGLRGIPKVSSPTASPGYAPEMRRSAIVGIEMYKHSVADVFAMSTCSQR